ncbi:MAG: ABC transporter permease [Streptococcaceae bacterium]|jgi:ABC-2 type transport system permease protein|nr:ABC transporter permease [Streptococcaceae bacterium]
MNFRQIKTLFKINLLYVNPQVTEQSRRKIKRGKKLSNSLLLQYSLVGIIYLLLFSVMMLTIDLPKYPGYFGMYFILYLVFAGSQAFAAFHNVMYESKDLKDLLPLPIASSSIFFAKFLTVTFTVVPYALPLLSLFLMTGFRATGIIGMILAILVFLITITLLMEVCIWLISLIVQTDFFQRYKKTANAILLILPTVGSMGAYFLLILQNNSQSDAIMAGKLADRPIIPFFTPVFDALVHPISLGSLLYWPLSLLVLAALYMVIQKRTIPKMFELQLSESPAKPKSARKKPNAIRSSSAAAKSSKSLSKQLFHYNLGLLKNPTLWMQGLINAYIMPFAMLFGVNMSTSINLSWLPLNYFAAFFLIGCFFALITISPASFCSLIISLDRENYAYITSLPMSLEYYLRMKFYFVVGLQTLLNTLVLTILSIILHIPFLLIVSLLLGNLLAQYIYSQFYYYRDFRLLNLNWTSISQLYTRGGGSWLTVGLLVGTILGGAIIAAIAFLLLTILPLPVLVNVVLIALTLLVFWLVERHYQKVFWKSSKIH